MRGGSCREERMRSLKMKEKERGIRKTRLFATIALSNKAKGSSCLAGELVRGKEKAAKLDR